MTGPVYERRALRNLRLGAVLGVVVVGMFGFGYALVPIYDVVCEALGLNGKTRSVAATVDAEMVVDTSREVVVEFVTQVNGSVPWQFEPEVRRVRVHPGALTEVNFLAHNRATAPLTAQAVPSVAPIEAARHFVKTECFCFTQQTLAAGATVTMPLRFLVDPRLPDKVGTITLSYTFFGVEDDGPGRLSAVLATQR